MMTRRVLCLLLAVQLLLVQGLLSRACTGSCGKTSHAPGRPHLHLSQRIPAAGGQERPGCPCCQRRLDRCAEGHAGRAAPQVHEPPRPAEGHADVIYLPASVVSTGQPKVQPRGDVAPANLAPDFAATPTPWLADRLPGSGETPSAPATHLCPILLRTLRLLI
jgi:hypothetical protein